MKKILVMLIILTLLLTACSSNDKTEEVKVDPAKAEDGLEDLKTMESFNRLKLNLIKERNNILSNVL